MTIAAFTTGPALGNGKGTVRLNSAEEATTNM